MDYNKFSGMSDGSFKATKPAVAPEDEFLHNIYITAKLRDNEDLGKMQIRGYASNLTEIYMIILKHKIVLAKEADKKTQCFSYRDGNDWRGTTRDEHGNLRQCGRTAADRNANAFCNGCKAQYIIAGLLVSANGSPLKDAKGNDVYAFIRAQRSRYGTVSDYVYSLCNRDFGTHLFGEDPQAIAFEKEVVNPMRVITKITVGTADSAYGKQLVFSFASAKDVPDKYIEAFLNRANDVLLPEFIKKIDWSKSWGSDQQQRDSSEPTFDNAPMNEGFGGSQSQPASTNSDFSFGSGGDGGFDFDDFKM